MSKATVLLTLGRLPPAVDVARSFAAQGWRVLVADPFRWHLARTSKAVQKSFVVPAPADDAEAFLRALLGIITAENVTLVVPISEETMHVSALHAQLPPDCSLFTPTQAAVLALHSKLAFTETARAAGLRVPRTARADSARADAIRATGDYMLKPEFSCSGRGVTRHAAATPLTIRSGQLVQRAIDGEELAAFAIAREGRIVFQCCYRARIRHGSVAVVFERVDCPAADAWLAQLVAHTAHDGFIAIDVIRDDEGLIWGIECNPRATSGLHFAENPAIAAAIIGGSESVGLRPERCLQEFWSTWTHYLSVLRNSDERRRTGRAIRAARDVSWRRDDPWVFLLATFSTWPIIRRAIRLRETFAEVLALDIEWQPNHEA